MWGRPCDWEGGQGEHEVNTGRGEACRKKEPAPWSNHVETHSTTYFFDHANPSISFTGCVIFHWVLLLTSEGILGRTLTCIYLTFPMDNFIFFSIKSDIKGNSWKKRNFTKRKHWVLSSNYSYFREYFFLSSCRASPKILLNILIFLFSSEPTPGFGMQPGG